MRRSEGEPPYRRLRRHIRLKIVVAVSLSGDNRGGFLHFANASVEMTLKERPLMSSPLGEGGTSVSVSDPSDE